MFLELIGRGEVSTPPASEAVISALPRIPVSQVIAKMNLVTADTKAISLKSYQYRESYPSISQFLWLFSGDGHGEGDVSRLPGQISDRRSSRYGHKITM